MRRFYYSNLDTLKGCRWLLSSRFENWPSIEVESHKGVMDAVLKLPLSTRWIAGPRSGPWEVMPISAETKGDTITRVAMVKLVTWMDIWRAYDVEVQRVFASQCRAILREDHTK